MRPIVVRPGGRGGLLWEERDDRRETTWCRESAIERRSDRTHARRHRPGSCPRPPFDRACLRPCSTCSPSKVSLRLDDSRLPHDLPAHQSDRSSAAAIAASPTRRAATAAWPSLGDDQGRPVAESIAAWRQRNAAAAAQEPGESSCRAPTSAAGSSVTFPGSTRDAAAARRVASDRSKPGRAPLAAG